MHFMTDPPPAEKRTANRAGKKERHRSAHRNLGYAFAKVTKARAPRIAAIAGGTVLLGLTFLSFPKVAEVGIDSSWQLIVGRAFQEQWQAGVDYVYPYGPLGYFGVPGVNYVRELFYPAVGWSLLAGLTFGWIFVMRGLRLQGWLRRLAFFVVLAAIVPILSPVGDALYLLAVFCVTSLAVEWTVDSGTPGRRVRLVAMTALLAVVSMIKFTYLLFAVLGIAVLCFVLLRRSMRRAAAGAMLAYVLAILAVWLFAGQTLRNLPSYFVRATNMALAYDDAMSLPADAIAMLFASGSIVAAVALAVGVVLDRPRDLSAAARVAMGIAALALAWKIGFGRYDPAHAGIFFSVTLIAPFLFEPTWSSGAHRARLFRGIAWIAFIVALAGAFYLALPFGYTPLRVVTTWSGRIVANVRSIARLRSLKAANEAALVDLAARHALPRIREAVGGASVDMFQSSQGLLFLNGLHYEPRPVPQGHLAYTPLLLDLNAEHFADSARAPQFVVFSVAPIDGRFPTLEDSQALQVMLRSYEPVLVEGGFLLLRRARPADGPAIGRRRLLAAHDVKIGQWTDVAAPQGGYLLARVELRGSLLGRLRATLYQSSRLLLEVETSGGTRFAGRLIPGIASQPFLLSPLMREQTDWLNWYRGTPPDRVTRLRLVMEDGRSVDSPETAATIELFDWEGPIAWN